MKVKKWRKIMLIIRNEWNHAQNGPYIHIHTVFEAGSQALEPVKSKRNLFQE